jgi:ribosome assembly protein 3
VKLKTQVPAKPVVQEDSSSSSSSNDESDSDEESIHQGDDVEMLDASVPTEKPDKQGRVVYSRSPSPIPAPVPSFLPTKPDGSADTEGEQQLKDRFRKFWMHSVADAFQDDLAQIHKVGVFVHTLKSGLILLPTFRNLE